MTFRDGTSRVVTARILNESEFKAYLDSMDDEPASVALACGLDVADVDLVELSSFVQLVEAVDRLNLERALQWLKERPEMLAEWLRDQESRDPGFIQRTALL